MKLPLFHRRRTASAPPEVWRQIWHKEKSFQGVTDVYSSGVIIDFIQWTLPAFSKKTHITRAMFPWRGFKDFNDFKARQSDFHRIK